MVGEREGNKVQINYAFVLMRKAEGSCARNFCKANAERGRKIRRQASHRVNRSTGRTGDAQEEKRELYSMLGRSKLNRSFHEIRQRLALALEKYARM